MKSKTVCRLSYWSFFVALLFNFYTTMLDLFRENIEMVVTSDLPFLFMTFGFFMLARLILVELGDEFES